MIFFSYLIKKHLEIFIKDLKILIDNNLSIVKKFKVVNVKKIFIVSGGTGGHIIPAHCLAKHLVEQNHKIYFLEIIKSIILLNLMINLRFTL